MHLKWKNRSAEYLTVSNATVMFADGDCLNVSQLNDYAHSFFLSSNVRFCVHLLTPPPKIIVNVILKNMFADSLI